jgi:hypothetical protein
MRLRLVLAAVLLTPLGVVTACQLIAGIGDKTIWDGGVVNTVCGAPDLPVTPAPGSWDDTTKITVTAALSQVMFGSSDGGPYYGFNLDKTCTCEFGQGESCLGSDASHCDDDGGIDNYARHAFEQINAFAISLGYDGGVITEQKFNSALSSGLSGAVLEISNYNGQANDGKVTVTIYGSQGYQGFIADGSAPKFDGGDPWVIDPASASGQYYVDDAYVTDFTLVATGLNFPIIVGSALTQPVTIQLDDGVIRAQLTMSGNSLTAINGTLGGRWDPAKFLPSLQSVPDPFSPGNYLCGDASTSLTYAFLKKEICASTDINRSSSGDTTGACNSVSMGLGFAALPAIKGPTGNVVTLAQPCGPNWKDDCSN